MAYTIKNQDDHSRTIVHIDLDCFYAQIEMIKNPSLRNVPLGIQQKSFVVTSNYIAREYGVKKCMSVTEALQVCPNLTLVNGEDLHDYRKISYKITTYLQNYSQLVERLGLDENYIDITDLVNSKIENCDIEVAGKVFGDLNELCQCGCELRLKIGTHIAQDIRDSIKTEFKLTCCAGIAHNKLLAKLVGAKNKPNQQTVVFPNSGVELILSLETVQNFPGVGSIQNIPGIGRATAEILQKNNIKTIEELQLCDIKVLVTIFGIEKARFLKDLSYGLDKTVVKISGRPNSIGLEDSCRTISVENEIKIKFNQLLNRLIILLQEDGRLPRTLKLTIRKFNDLKKFSNRETKQCNVSPSLFIHNNVIQLTFAAETKLMAIIMNLFNRLVNVHKPFHITLLGLSFTKFQERVNGKHSIVSFLCNNLEVQSLTSIASTDNYPEDDKCKKMLENIVDSSESEMEPSPKRGKKGITINKHRFRDNIDDCASPSKLPVAQLRLNSTEKLTSDSNHNIQCPPNADENVFKELPKDVQKELWDDYKKERDREKITFSNQIKKPKTNTLLNYFVRK